MMAGFMILGAILSMGKCSFLIAGCNMMNRGLASIILQNSVLLSASLYFLVGSIAFAVIYAGTGRRFKK